MQTVNLLHCRHATQKRELWHRGGESDRRRGKDREEIVKECQEKKTQGLGGRKWEERKELWEEKEDEEWLQPKWQRLHLHPLFPWSWPTLLGALFFHISHSLPSIPLFGYLNLSILLLSSRPAQTEGWRVQALQRQQCGDCMSCGSHSSLACRLHRQLLLQLILDQLSSDRRYIWIIWSGALDKQLLETRCSPAQKHLAQRLAGF